MDYSNFLCSASHTVRIPLVAHEPNDTFDEFWSKCVPFGTQVDKFSTLTSRSQYLIFCRFFVKITPFMQLRKLHKSCALNRKYCIKSPSQKRVSPVRCFKTGYEKQELREHQNVMFHPYGEMSPLIWLLPTVASVVPVVTVPYFICIPSIFWSEIPKI